VSEIFSTGNALFPTRILNCDSFPYVHIQIAHSTCRRIYMALPSFLIVQSVPFNETQQKSNTTVQKLTQKQVQPRVIDSPNLLVTLEHYSASKLFAAVREAFSNACPDKEVPNKTTIHRLLITFRDTGSVCL
jgi:hypothetical protein